MTEEDVQKVARYMPNSVVRLNFSGYRERMTDFGRFGREVLLLNNVSPGGFGLEL